MAKCNARPKPLPEYIHTGCNVMKREVEEIRISLTALTDDELLAIIDKVSKIHSGKLIHCYSTCVDPNFLDISSFKKHTFTFNRTCRGTNWLVWPSSCFRVDFKLAGKESRFLSSRLSELVNSSQHGRIGYFVLSTRFRQHCLRWIWFRKR